MRAKTIAMLSALALSFCSAHADDKLHQRPRYLLHPGDVVELNYRLSPEFNQTVTLDPDGHANLAIAGDMPLAGLTLEQAKAQILNAVSVRLERPELNLILRDFQHPYVVVGGEVQSPGKIEMREDLTAMQALILAGGPKYGAATGRVLLFRHINKEWGEVRELNLSKMKKTADLERDMQLEPGDMLFVSNTKLDKVERFMRAANFGLYLNPLQNF
jgi:polysaccharide biosynthesis/export protein